VSATCEQPDIANAWVNFLLDPERVAQIADAQNVIPGRADAIPLTEKFVAGGALEPFFKLSEAQALIRPPTPAYLGIAKTFEKVAADIANGADVQSTLDAAVDEIDKDIENNGGYGFQ
jgi:multiple sugar transport system substrate-binding protein